MARSRCTYYFRRFERKTFSFDEAAAFIIENFNKFSPKMAKFAQSAFEKSWIEAEDRPGKRPGGYCTELPETKESRIFMTYSNSVNEVATLAHELGHAFHSSTMWDLPSLNREYAMNVAETASTFAELIVADATLKVAKQKKKNQFARYKTAKCFSYVHEYPFPIHF